MITIEKSALEVGKIIDFIGDELIIGIEEDMGLKTIKEGLVTTIRRGKNIEGENRILEMTYLLWGEDEKYNTLRRVNLMSINPNSTNYDNLNKELAGVGM